MMQQPVWLNSLIKSNDQVIHNSWAIEVGYYYVLQMISEQGVLGEFQKVSRDSLDTGREFY